MNVSQAIESYIAYHRANSKKNTIRNHEYVLERFREQINGQIPVTPGLSSGS